MHAVPGLLGAVGTQLWNTGKYTILGEYGLLGAVSLGNAGFEMPELGEDESGLEYYTRLYPLTGGIATGAVNFYNRWINFEDGGTDWGRLGDDYYFAPVSTALEDAGTVLLVAGGSGAILKGISLGAKGVGAAAAGATARSGLRGALTSVGTRVGSLAPRLNTVSNGLLRATWAGAHVEFLPLKLNFMAARGAVGLVSRHGLAPAGRWATARGLGRFGSALETSAYAGGIIRRGGIFGRITMGGTYIPGLIGTMRTYRSLGLPFGLGRFDAQTLSALRGGRGAESGALAQLRTRVPDEAVLQRLLDRAGDPDTLGGWLRSHATPDELAAALDTIWAKVPDAAQRARLMAVVDRPASLAKYLERVSPAELERSIAATQRTGVPGGIDAAAWRGVAANLKAAAEQWGGRPMVQGSRAAGVPGPKSDLDIAIVMDRATYDAALIRAFKTTPEQIAEMRRIPESEYKTVVPTSNLRSLWYAANKGKISRGWLKLSKLGKDIEKTLALPKSADISAILKGGDLDQGPYLPLP